MKEFKYVLYLFACAAKGEKADRTENINIKDIYAISVRHGIWGIIFPVIRDIYETNENAFDLKADLFERLNAEFLKTVYKNLVKWQLLPQIIEKLQKSGIDVCLLKGLTLGVLYNEPYARPTTDIDLLISVDDEKKAVQILEADGFETKFRTEGSHHTKCVRKDIGLLELHTQLYDKEVQELWFEMDTAQEYERIDFEYDSLKCKQLNHTDALIFNFLHFVKHYIHGLITVKQLMDVMLYIKKYKNEIDFAKFERVMSNLNYLKLYKVFKCMAVEYMGFSPDELGEDDSLLEYSCHAHEVLEDMNKNAAADNASVYHVYSKRLYEKKQKIEKKSPSLPKRVRRIIGLIWADKKKMKESYSILNKHIWLMPVMQLHRIFNRVLNIKKYINQGEKRIEKESRAAQDRIILLQKLDVL